MLIPSPNERAELRRMLELEHQSLARWALVCCNWHRADAEDALQNAYERVLDGRARFKGQSQFRTWIFGVVRNCSREQRRFLRRWDMSGEVPVQIDASDPGADTEAILMAQRLRTALLKLSRKQREILSLVYYSELTVEEAARIMDLSLGSARTHYHRGKKRLCKLLEADDD